MNSGVCAKEEMAHGQNENATEIRLHQAKRRIYTYPQSKRCIHWAIICVTREGLEITNPYAPLHKACRPHPAVQSNMVYLLQLHSWLLPELCGRLINADC